MKTSANIATYAPRIESLKVAVKSLYNQVDVIRICFNGFTRETVPDHFKQLDKVEIIIPNEDLTDNGKFYSLDLLKEDEYYLTCDDDLIYSPQYVQTTLDNIKKFGTIITYHGRILNGMGREYYYGHLAYKCLQKQDMDYLIDVAGTGVAGFDTRYFKPKFLAYAKEQKMSDLIFSLEAARQGKKIGCCKRDYGFLRHIDNKETIHGTESRKETPIQNRLADEIFKLKNEGRNY